LTLTPGRTARQCGRPPARPSSSGDPRRAGITGGCRRHDGRGSYHAPELSHRVEPEKGYAKWEATESQRLVCTGTLSIFSTRLFSTRFRHSRLERVDEIIQKISAATDKGLEAGVQKGPIKAGGSRKKQAQVQEELVLTRTYFSAFEAWYERMAADEALGEFDAWDIEVRDAIDVGDTIRFQADVVLSPLYHVIAAYTSFVKDSSNPASVL
jgi:hypothetical protein